MKKFHLQTIFRKGMIALLLVFCFGNSSEVFSQERYQPPGYDEHILPEGSENSLKSGEATEGSSWTTSYNSNGWRSDYYVFFQWSDLTWHCDCNHRYNIKF